ncbi:hypothetical protein [Geotalea toluenoxydans]|uniref:hypothetical protein n=1 Tax=Geotalea toluenoxydans TaxID=421624 RepID=UPI0006D1AC12|nr:hypothetical protein [Geotalea toluenoxydans]
MILSLAGCGTTDTIGGAKNVILVVADGMQLEHERAAGNYLYGAPEGALQHQKYNYKGAASTWDVTTYNRYAFAAYSSNGFSSRRYSDATVNLENLATFDPTLAIILRKGENCPIARIPPVRPGTSAPK